MSQGLMEQLLARATLWNGQSPCFNGTGLGLLPLLCRDTTARLGVVCVDDLASPVAAWLAAQPQLNLYSFIKPTRMNRQAPRLRPQGHWDANTIPVVMADNERLVLDVDDIAHGLGSRPVLYKERSLDSLLGDHKEIGFIHLGSVNGSSLVIDGACEFLTRANPVVQIARDRVVREQDLSELTALESSLSQLGYTLYDSMLKPLRSVDELRQALNVWCESIFFGFPPGYDVEGLIRTTWQDLVECSAKWKLSSSLDAADFTETEGFYSLESWEDLTWRWTGPRPVARISVPVARPGSYWIHFHLLKVANKQVLDTLRLVVNGELVPHTTVERAHHLEVSAPARISMATFTPVLSIQFAHSDTYVINPEDPRRLGFALMKVVLERKE